MAMFEALGPDLHVMAVCQPSVPVLAAIARMEAEDRPLVPRSAVLVGGPIDTRCSPTAVNKLPQEKRIGWFEQHCIHPVPWTHQGYGRKVYPGFLQLAGFISMNLDRHQTAHWDMFNHLVQGDGDSAAKHREFYDEYLAVMDLTAEYYLQTVETVFIEHHLPKGEMRHRGKPVDLTAIRRCALMAIEGEKDDITGIGQTRAALDLTANLPARRKPTTSRWGGSLRHLQRLALPRRDRAEDRRVHGSHIPSSGEARKSSSSRPLMRCSLI